MEEKKIKLWNFIPDEIVEKKVVNMQYIGVMDTSFLPGIVSRELWAIGYGEDFLEFSIIEVIFDDSTTATWLSIENIVIDNVSYEIIYLGFDKFAVYNYKKHTISIYNLRGKF